MAQDLLWSIVSLDSQVQLTIVGQYKPEGIEVSKGAKLGSISTPGTVAPAVQWISNTERVLRFSAEFKAQDCMTNIQSTYDLVDRLNVRDSTLGRAPKILLTWGGTSIRGYVSSKSLKVVGYYATGFMKGFTFDIEVTEAPDVQLELSSPAPGETQYLTLGDGETFEHIALKMGLDPLKGELIRRENPSIASRLEQAGDKVKVLEADHERMQEEVEPLSLPFLGDNWTDVVQTLARSRGTSSDAGMTWDMLPEVLAGEVAY